MLSCLAQSLGELWPKIASRATEVTFAILKRVALVSLTAFVTESAEHSIKFASVIPENWIFFQSFARVHKISVDCSPNFAYCFASVAGQVTTGKRALLINIFRSEWKKYSMMSTRFGHVGGKWLVATSWATLWERTGLVAIAWRQKIICTSTRYVLAMASSVFTWTTVRLVR